MAIRGDTGNAGPVVYDMRKRGLPVLVASSLNDSGRLRVRFQPFKRPLLSGPDVSQKGAQKGAQRNSPRKIAHNSLILVVREGLEPSTSAL